MIGPLVLQLSDTVTIIRGDCREVLPTLGSVDAIVTDPPYGLGERMSGGTWGKADKYGAMWVWDKVAPIEVIEALLSFGKPTILWGGNYYPVPPSRCWLSWSKINSVPTMASMELAWTNFDRPAKEWRGAVGVHDTGHPTQKPEALMKWCLSFVPEACVVLDPFMGSGTTGLACLHTGRRFIGIEIDAHYFNIARQRLENELAQGRLFDGLDACPGAVDIDSAGAGPATDTEET